MKVGLGFRGPVCHLHALFAPGNWTYFCVPLSLAACPVYVSFEEYKNLDYSGYWVW